MTRLGEAVTAFPASDITLQLVRPDLGSGGGFRALRVNNYYTRVVSDEKRLAEGVPAGISFGEGASAVIAFAEGKMALCKRETSRFALCKRETSRPTLAKRESV